MRHNGAVTECVDSFTLGSRNHLNFQSEPELLNNKASRPNLIMLITEEWYFRSHRRDLTVGLADTGRRVSVATRCSAKIDELNLDGEPFELIHLPFRRSLKNPLIDIYLCLLIPWLLRRRSPRICHAIAMKPILLTFLAVKVNPGIKFVHSFAGMGYLFTSKDKKANVFKPIAEFLLRNILGAPNSWVIVQNADDEKLLIERKLARAEKIRLIPGSGIDTVTFSPARDGHGRVKCKTVIIVARLVREKGIEEFVYAARTIKARGYDTRFALVGEIDLDNPGSFNRIKVQGWVNDGYVEWWGHHTNMVEVYQRADIVCLPSYREGLPKVLLEAAACGKPMVASDVPGCRDICIDGQTGILVPAKNETALADAIIQLLENEDLAKRYGNNARALVVEKMSLSKIVKEFDDFYGEITT